MQDIDSAIKNIIRIYLPLIPKPHLFASVGLVCSLAIITQISRSGDEVSTVQSNVEIPALALLDKTIEEPFPKQTIKHDKVVSSVAAPTYVEEQQIETMKRVIKKGDTLSSLFKSVGLRDKHMYEVLNSSSKGKKLASIYPGHTISFGLKEDKLHSIHYQKNKLNSFSFMYSDESEKFVYSENKRKPDVKLAVRSAVISNSMYEAGLDAKLDEKLIMQLATIFGWDIDFALDIRKGDAFTILYEERFLDGEKLGNGAILAAEFVNRGSRFQALRYINSEGDANYYTPDGASMRKAFLRAPLDFRRISGNFNPRRLHPIFKTVKPHRGVDYAANRGTHVWASGDGRVIASGYSRANGNFVFIQHGNDIQTKYLHLHKRHVKRGQRVRQKDVIGTVGATGYATGPHLHYEFLVNGVHRNPRTIVNKLPKAKSIHGDELARFRNQTSPLLAELEQTTQLAMAKP